MDSIAVLPLSGAFSTVRGRSLPCILTCSPVARTAVTSGCGSFGPRRRRRLSKFRRPDALLFAASGTANSVPPQEGMYTVGDFMMRREALHVVGPTTTVDEALETLVEKRITGFPVVDDDGKLVSVVSDYDLLALDSFKVGLNTIQICSPSSIALGKYTFNEIQKLLSKTNGRVVGDLMTPSPLVVRENTNLEDAVRILLKTKYRRLPVVDGDGTLIGMITRGDIVRGALQIKQANEKNVNNIA